jgi:hypothetical protein
MISPPSMSDELPFEPPRRPETIWFAPRCCVVVRPEGREVFAGGVFLGAFGRADTAQRNVLLVTLAEQSDVHLGKLSRAFGLTADAVRLLRRLYEEEGLEPVIQRKRGGSTSEVSGRTVRRLEKMFERGVSVSAAFAAVGAAAKSRPTVGRIRKTWGESQVALARLAKAEEPVSIEGARPGEPPRESKEEQSPVTGTEGGEPVALTLVGQSPASAVSVQHVGTWMLMAVVHSLGLHRKAVALAGNRVKADALRLALDATIAALALGERCVEGVRRLATTSAATLLLANRVPSPTWTRRTLGQFSAPLGGALLQQWMASEYLARAKADAGQEGPVFFVDNHHRPYTGKERLLHGWRMQDKRVLPGASDYYVHDEDGRVIRHVVAPAHGSLTQFLTPICEHLRLALGPEEAILVAFDRAGAFPQQMAELRDEDFEFVTYERRPYALLAEAAFTDTVVVDGERWLLHESRANLGGGRGRVRRLSLRTPDAHQVNLLAISGRSAKRLVEVLFSRWRQENAFKHANERWGINQLDGRTVHPYPEDTVIPNPARRRLENALALARVSEGFARNELARLPANHARRAEVAAALQESVEEQQGLEVQRPDLPKHALLRDTELSGKLVHHSVEYKLTIDTIRAACLNAEADLALLLAPHLPKPSEAKKVLANLFAAPGRVQVSARTIAVTLAPAATKPEREAIAQLFAVFNKARFSLPGDQKSRALRFQQAELR